jgi:hypothetical protein
MFIHLKINNMRFVFFLFLAFVFITIPHYKASSQTSSQPKVILTLEESGSTTDRGTGTCYAINLKLTSPKAVILAGQNYRLYYDSENSTLEEKSIESYLPASYTGLKLQQHMYDIDASGFGVLGFEGNMGFINIATDFNLNQGGGVKLHPGKEYAVGKFCFTEDRNAGEEIVWSRDHLTHTYATAFVELSYYDERELRKLPIEKYEVRYNERSVVQEAEVLNVDMYPNPFLDELYISFNMPLPGESELMIFDLFGKLIYREKLESGRTDYRLDAERLGLSAGACIIEIHEKDGTIHTKKAIRIK